MPSFIVSVESVETDRDGNVGGNTIVVASDEQDAKNQGASLFGVPSHRVTAKRWEDPAWTALKNQ